MSLLLVVLGCVGPEAPEASTPWVCAGQTDAPEGAVHVDAAAAPGGDGSAAAPFPRLGEAVSAAPEGATVWIAPGTYAETPEVATPDLHLVAACPGSTSLVADTPAVALTIEAEGVRVEGLEVRGGQAGGVLVAGVGGVELDGLVVADNQVAGLSVIDGAEVWFGDGIVRTTTCLDLAGAGCAGVLVLDATLTVEGAVVEANEGHGIYIHGGTLAASGSRIADQVPDREEGWGFAVEGTDADLVLGPDLEIVRPTAAGVLALGGTLTTRGEVVVSDLFAPGGGYALGILRVGEARLGDGLRVEDAAATALYLSGGAETAVVEGLSVEGACGWTDIAPAILVESPATFAGVSVSDTDCVGIFTAGVEVDLTGVVVEAATGAGVEIVGGAAHLAEVSVRGTRGARGGHPGYGVLVDEGTLDGAGVEVSDNEDAGLVAWRSEVELVDLVSEGNEAGGVLLFASDATLTDPVVGGTRPSTERGGRAYGVYSARTDVDHAEPIDLAAGLAGHLSVVGGTFSDNDGAHVVVADGLTAEVSGRFTGAEVGVVAVDGAEVEVAGAELTDHPGLSLLFDASGGSVADTVSTDAVGVVQQRCEGVGLVTLSRSTVGAVHLCDGTEVAWPRTPLAWSDDVDLD